MLHPLTISRLQSGGLITNYHCTGRCGHCLYKCSPQRKKDYITPQSARQCLRMIQSMGCASVHIGGGEPMLNPRALKEVLTMAREERVGIDYVETNSSWYTGKAHAIETLAELRKAGLRTLLLSISPFHNAAVPLNRIKGAMVACRETGIQIFPWIPDYLSDLSRFDETRPHPLEEYRHLFGKDYLLSVLQRYWIHLGGRALDTYRPLLPSLTPEQIMHENPGSCRTELSNTTHFHVDLYENYIPGLCAGLAFPASLLGRPLDADQYPVLTVLWNTGISGFYKGLGKCQITVYNVFMLSKRRVCA